MGTMQETILLVDDHRAVRRALRVVLERAGYGVLEAPSGERAVEIAREHGGAIHLLVTDVVMPGQDGFELAQIVRSLRPAVKVLFISGHLGDRLTARPVESMGSYLAKPFRAPDLRRALDELRAQNPAGRRLPAATRPSAE